ncbi:hypothetical protein NS226_20225 [Aureimonas ureilytica]|uniref:Uncharacterized protein n=1 Tax=Aureimonas ureilytica TaxID=401562 RepID=A0A175R3D6_9HYPH|nr:hypothetical protein NS226_20225 [Aureimonas ureilytica]
MAPWLLVGFDTALGPCRTARTERDIRSESGLLIGLIAGLFGRLEIWTRIAMTNLPSTISLMSP